MPLLRSLMLCIIPRALALHLGLFYMLLAVFSPRSCLLAASQCIDMQAPRPNVVHRTEGIVGGSASEECVVSPARHEWRRLAVTIHWNADTLPRLLQLTWTVYQKLVMEVPFRRLQC